MSNILPFNCIKSAVLSVYLHPVASPRRRRWAVAVMFFLMSVCLLFSGFSTFQPKVHELGQEQVCILIPLMPNGFFWCTDGGTRHAYATKSQLKQ